MGWFTNIVSKALPAIQTKLRNTFMPKWVTVSRRASTAYSDLFHTSPQLDAVDIISTDYANAGFKIFNKHHLRTDEKNAEALGDHPAYDVLENPIPDNPSFDGFSLRYLTNVYLEIHGECFWFVLRDIHGIPREIYLAPTTWVIQTPFVNHPVFLLMPLGNNSSMTMEVPKEDVVYFKMPNAVQPYDRGRGRTETIGTEIEAYEYAMNYARNFFFNDATPRTIVTAPGASEDQVKAFKAAWDLNFRGVSNGNKTGFVGWDSKVLKLSDNPHEMDFIESMKALAEKARSHYQIPPEIFGIMNDAKRATVDAAQYLYAKNVLVKRFARHEAVLNRQFMPMFGNKDEVIKFDNPVQEDLEFKLKVANDGWENGALIRDEWRTANGYKALGGETGNELKISMGETALLATGAIPKRLAVIEPVAEPLAIVPGEVGNVPSSKSMRQIVDDISTKALSDSEKEAAWQEFYKIEQANWPGFIQGAKAIAVAQKKQFRNLFDAYIGDEEDPVNALNKATAEIYGSAVTNGQTFAKLAPAWAKALRDGFDIADKMLGGGIDWKLYNPKLTEWLKTHGLEAAKEINGTTKKELLALAPKIEEALANGKSIADIGRMLDKVYTKLGTTRANLIAETESMTSINNGQFLVYRGEGVIKKTWLHSMLPNGRDNHKALNGVTIGIDEKFNMGGNVHMLHPGDQEGGASNIISCHCTIVPGDQEE